MNLILPVHFSHWSALGIKIKLTLGNISLILPISLQVYCNGLEESNPTQYIHNGKNFSFLMYILNWKFTLRCLSFC